MTHFITDEHGNRTFEHAARQAQLTLVALPLEKRREIIANVEIWPEGIRVYGDRDGFAVVIPWPVVEAIVAAHAIVG